MLCLDVETTGLDPTKARITCVCVFDEARGIERRFIFDQPPQSEDSLRQQGEIMMLLDDAPHLCGFNSARFDLPFLAQQWGVADERLGEWVMKLVDIFELAKLCLNKTFTLNALLKANNLESKSGSGLEAINMAARGEWDALADYCMTDVKLTHKVTTLPVVVLPKTHLRWSLMRGFFVP